MSAGNSTYFSGKTSNVPSPQVRFLAFADINKDGFLDFIGQVTSSTANTPTRLCVALGAADGSFSTVTSPFNGTAPEFIDPRVMVGDFTGDGRVDIAVYDAGYYDWTARLTMGREPVLLVRGSDGRYTTSTALKNAMQPLVQPGPVRSGVQTDLTVGVKDVAVADIDRDGDLDMWIESTGSANATSHFLINNGSGTFTVDLDNRLPATVLFGPNYGAGDYYRYGIGRFVDVNADGSPDLLLGQIRDNDSTHIGQSSYVVLNNGSGAFTQNIRLPLPDFYYGYTAVMGVAAGDIDGDGRNDLVLIHTRNDDVSGSSMEQPWTGTYVQILMQRSDGQFSDQTATRLGNQAAWSAVTLPQYQHARDVAVVDVNNDGYLDIVLSYSEGQRPSASKPIVLLGGPERFTATDASLLTGGDQFYGEGIRPLHFNGDGRLDFVHLDSAPGPNGVYQGWGTDDNTVLVTQLGTARFGGTIYPEYSGKRADYMLTKVTDGFRIAGNGANHVYKYADRVEFSDMSVALDLAGNAGMTAKILGAVFGKSAVSNKTYVGIGLDLFDDGMSYQAVMQLALNARLGSGASHEAIVNLLYTNVVGQAPDAATRAAFVGLLASGTHTPASLGVLAADHALNTAGIGLVGLATTGLEYIPVA